LSRKDPGSPIPTDLAFALETLSTTSTSTAAAVEAPKVATVPRLLRTIFYGAVHEEADIWIAERK
jgi:hypothetical protein